MKKKQAYQKTLLFILLLLVMMATKAQTGLNFQGVARTSSNVLSGPQGIQGLPGATGLTGSTNRLKVK